MVDVSAGITLARVRRVTSFVVFEAFVISGPLVRSLVNWAITVDYTAHVVPLSSILNHRVSSNFHIISSQSIILASDCPFRVMRSQF